MNLAKFLFKRQILFYQLKRSFIKATLKCLLPQRLIFKDYNFQYIMSTSNMLSNNSTQKKSSCTTCETLAILLLKEKEEKERIAQELYKAREKIQHFEISHYEQDIKDLKGELINRNEIISKLSQELDMIKKGGAAKQIPNPKNANPVPQQPIAINRVQNNNNDNQKQLNVQPPLNLQKNQNEANKPIPNSQPKDTDPPKKKRIRKRLPPKQSAPIKDASNSEAKQQPKPQDQKPNLDQQIKKPDRRRGQYRTANNQNPQKINAKIPEQKTKRIRKNQESSRSRRQSNVRRSNRSPRGQFVKIDGVMVQIPIDNEKPVHHEETKKVKIEEEEESKNDEKQQMYELSHSSSIHAQGPLEDRQNQNNGEFRNQSGSNNGRLKCPAVTCGATRGLIQSMKQHVRETRGLNGHDRVLCVKCDSVFFKKTDRDQHDQYEDCIQNLIHKPKALLSQRQRQLIQLIEDSNNDNPHNHQLSMPNSQDENQENQTIEEDLQLEVVDQPSAV